MNSKRLKILYFVSFFMATQGALTTYVNSTFLSAFIAPQLVGLVYTLAAILASAGLFLVPRLPAKIGNYRTYILTGLGILLSLAGLSALRTTAVVPIFIVYMGLSYLIYFSLDIFIESMSEDESTGGIRGASLTAINLGWVFAPLISSLVIMKAGYGGMYAFSALCLLPAILLIVYNFKDFKDPAYQENSVRESVELMTGNEDLSRIYSISFLLQFFYVVMTVYTPIYLYRYLHFSWETIGLIFLPMLASFVILQYPLGRWADEIGEKEMINAGFLMMALSTAALAYLPGNAWLWTAGLFLTRVGAATVEVMSETYFFKKVAAKDSRAIGLFRSAAPISYIIAPILVTVFLYLFPFRQLFIAAGALMFLGLLVNYRLRDTA